MDSGEIARPAKLKTNFFNKTDTDYTSDESSALLGGPIAVPPESKYTPRQEPTTSGKTSSFGAVFIVVNACIGAGLLNFPAAYQAAGGIAVGTSMQLGFLLFIIASLLVLAVCADVRNSNSYQDIIQSMCGTTGNIACTICIIIYCFGTCVTFFIIIGDQLDSILAFITHDDDKHGHWYTDRRFTITILAVFVILPLCLPKDISILKWPSSVGVLGTIYVAAVVVANYYLLPANAATHIVTKPTSWTDVFAAIPTICFGFQCHISAVPVYASLKKRTVSQFALVITGALVIASVTYILTGIYGSLTFGDQVESDVLLSYDAGNVTVTVARAMILCNMLTSYPILHFCGRLAIETVYTTARGLSPAEAAHKETPRRIIETTSWFVLSLLLALFVSSIGSVISVIGGLAAVFILVFPGLCLVQYALTTTSVMGSRTLTWCQIGLGIIFIAMGVFMLGESVTAAIIKDVVKMD
ncbi:putative sodium-coupled neutral amino acid transporter 7 isoform X1 [Asterias rubens]|uniref:putative sodium-coupled neutral amino acid transporter 7 isoform X1 n=1 Tax=Asterias rubens TaxID=7604 RepID=UPI001455272F|nr:putative sodium-coupled neutral amino acid transporter 7 isoform X1 [Asterias rubens]XP_033626903.1 putative sodium-coupled neutral amino acid transporter 7 isoform X1 [Asterias rubens]XP_033626904.1 putative sodium-coupled neutral amino acid transporter 7 isoform X1 [Asterias rubens]